MDKEECTVTKIVATPVNYWSFCPGKVPFQVLFRGFLFIFGYAIIPVATKWLHIWAF